MEISNIAYSKQSPRVIEWLKALKCSTGRDWEFHTGTHWKMCRIHCESTEEFKELSDKLPEYLSTHSRYYQNVEEVVIYEEDMHAYFGRGRDLSKQLGIL